MSGDVNISNLKRDSGAEEGIVAHSEANVAEPTLELIARLELVRPYIPAIHPSFNRTKNMTCEPAADKALDKEIRLEAESFKDWSDWNKNWKNWSDWTDWSDWKNDYPDVGPGGEGDYSP